MCTYIHTYIHTDTYIDIYTYIHDPIAHLFVSFLFHLPIYYEYAKFPSECLCHCQPTLSWPPFLNHQYYGY